MGATWAGRLAATFGVLWIPIAALGDDSTRPAGSAVAFPVARTSPTPTDPAVVPPSLPPVDAAKVRAELNERLAHPIGGSDKDASPASRALVEVLKERLRWLDEWDAAVKVRREAEHPEPSPEAQAAEWRADLERVKALLGQAAKDPAELLPAAFRLPADQVNESVRSEMKDAIEAVKGESKDWKARRERLRSDAGQKGANPVASLQAERDRIHQHVTSLAPRRTERQAALAAAKTTGERTLAAERLLNFEWESRVEFERLLGTEARIALESKRADNVALNQEVLDAHIRLADKSLDLMQTRYRAMTDRQEHDLKQEAASEQKRAAKAEDPLERYRARRMADLLELKAQVLKNEDALASSPSPCLEEQRSLADREDVDLANLKHLLDDGKVSQLDALRLNNDFRRIGPQRARIVRHELADAARQLTYYENALSCVELDLINDRRADQYEHDALLEQLPRGRHAEAKALFAELDRRHDLLLGKDRDALAKLAQRAEQTHDQVLRRLRTLDDQYGFIRTHIFWVRDQETLGLMTLEQARRESSVVGKALFRLTMEAGDASLWGRVSAEFFVGLLGMLGLPWPLLRLQQALASRPKGTKRLDTPWQALRGLLVGVGFAAVWPIYLGLMAYTARQASWPRSLAVPVSSALAILAPAAFAAALVRWILRRGGWAEEALQLPAEVARQLRRAVLLVVLAGVPLLLPQWLLGRGLIAPGGRPISAPGLCRLLGFGFELIVWGVVFVLTRGRSALVQWLLQFPERLGWLNRHRRVLCWSGLAAIAGVIVLDALGFSFTASRLAIGAGQGLVLLGFCWVLYRIALRAIDHHAWRWLKADQGQADAAGTSDDSGPPDDLAARLRRLTGYLVPAFGAVLAAWIWDVDWALFRFLGEQQLWETADKVPVTVGDFAKFALILGLTAATWRHLSTFFAVAVFPRMRDDPGVRFAVVTLCRYAVLGVGLLSGLSAIHLGLEKIGMVLAALGVGLGFGLQEIVSNFVCGIILLLERPIRVGDVVTVSGMTGKVDRINIRATTITNGDNQSIIVPNRAFITSDLVNWTLKDKVIRVTIRVRAEHGTDPDRVSEILLGLAREDADVLRNPLPASYMEDFTDSALSFVLYVHVPEPSLASRVRHRLFSQIQKKFEEAAIRIPLPAQELRVQSLTDQAGRPRSPADFHRLDAASTTPPVPRFAAATAPPIPEAVEDCHRGVDE